MDSLLSSCYPSAFADTVKIPKQKFMETCSSKFIQVPPDEKRVPSKNYYIKREPKTSEGLVQIQKIGYNRIPDDIVSMGLVYTDKGFLGGKRKSQRRNKKTRKPRRKTRRHRTRRM